MARTVNKSEVVRNFLTDHPDLGPKAISEALSKQGIEVSPNYVSNVKLKLKTHGLPRGQGRPPGSTKKSLTTYEPVVEAAKFIKKCGGVEQAKNALAVAEEIMRASS